jgi:hypothetical protein
MASNIKSQEEMEQGCAHVNKIKEISLHCMSFDGNTL